MFYEDVVDGAVFRTGSHVVSFREIAEFASRFDPQPIRLDVVFAADLEWAR
jgi:acyl dehydratase